MSDYYPTFCTHQLPLSSLLFFFNDWAKSQMVLQMRTDLWGLTWAMPTGREIFETLKHRDGFRKMWGTPMSVWLKSRSEILRLGGVLFDVSNVPPFPHFRPCRPPAHPPASVPQQPHTSQPSAATPSPRGHSDIWCWGLILSYNIYSKKKKKSKNHMMESSLNSYPQEFFQFNIGQSNN